MLKRHNRKAFTLVELIVVIVILAVLAAIAFMVLEKMIWKSRDSRRVADLSTMTKALEVYLFSPDVVVTLAKTWAASETDSTSFSLSGKNAVIVYQGPFSNSYWTKLKNAWFDSLNKLPKDPKWMPYVIWVYGPTLKDFSLGATLENVDADTVGSKAAIDWNSFNKKFIWTWTLELTMPTLILSWSYNSDYTIYTIDDWWSAIWSIATMTWLAISDAETARYPYAQ